ncbi:MAG: FadR/GntR family transcriptional regulator [Clostridia bacterium]|nr:FadR/GntR family transcriptional regulator [Clostridia bacterium]
MKPVKRVRAGDAVADMLFSAITNGDYKPGEKLPPENQLAAMANVSRNVLREAVRQLEGLGLLTVRQGDGTYVNDMTVPSLINKAAEYLVFGDISLIDLVEARQALEVRAASLAAERAKSHEIDRLQELVEAMESSQDSRSAYFQLDLEFHRTVVAAAHNVVFARLFATVQQSIVAQLERLSEIEGITGVSNEYHRLITDAIAARDPKTAGCLMDEHIARARRRLYEETARRATQP